MITKFNNSRKELIDLIDLQKLHIKLEEAFKGLKTRQTIQPEQIALIAPNNDDCIIYTAANFSDDIVGVKLSPFISERSKKGLNPVTAYTFLLSMTSGEPILVCDSFHLTAIRTAATSILAVTKLKPNTQKLAIIGFGSIGQEHLRLAQRNFDWNEINIFSPSISDNKEKGDNILIEQNIESKKVSFTNNLEEAIQNADVIMMCTSSKTSVLDINTTKSNCIISSIVTNSSTAHEVNPESLTNCTIYCDYLPNCLNVAGEFKILKESNKLDSLNIVGDLSDLCADNCDIQVNINSRRYFRSVGLGIEDIVIAKSLAV